MEISTNTPIKDVSDLMVDHNVQLLMALSAQNSDLSIFVGGLMNSTTNDDLFRYFSAFGAIMKCEAQMWKNNPAKCRGFAVLTVGDRHTYEAVLQQQHVLGGRNVECKPLVKDRSQLSTYCREELDKKLYVSGISKKVTDQMLRDYFSKYGEVKIAYIVRHHKDSKPKGFGFVSFVNKEAKDEVLRQATHSLLGKQVFCTEYSTKADLKKTTKSKNCQVQEEHFQTSDNNSDQETQSNHFSHREGDSSTTNQHLQGNFRSPAENGFYGQSWHQDCTNTDLETTAQTCCQQSPQTTPGGEYWKVYNYPAPLYSPFRGSNSFAAKLARKAKGSSYYAHTTAYAAQTNVIHLS